MASLFPADLLTEATRLLSALRERELKLAVAESCTGGMIAALLTEIPGSSDVLDRGFVTYSNDAKIEMIGVHSDLIEEFCESRRSSTEFGPSVSHETKPDDEPERNGRPLLPPRGVPEREHVRSPRGEMQPSWAGVGFGLR